MHHSDLMRTRLFGAGPTRQTACLETSQKRRENSGELDNHHNFGKGNKPRTGNDAYEVGPPAQSYQPIRRGGVAEAAE
jgi:hypothetical protein